MKKLISKPEGTAGKMLATVGADSGAAAAAIQNAIASANLPANGAHFYPFSIKVATSQELPVIWQSQRGDTPISFCQVQPLDPNYLPLGDIAFINNGITAAYGPCGFCLGPNTLK